jgi:ferredoxin
MFAIVCGVSQWYLSGAKLTNRRGLCVVCVVCCVVSGRYFAERDEGDARDHELAKEDHATSPNNNALSLQASQRKEIVSRMILAIAKSEVGPEAITRVHHMPVVAAPRPAISELQRVNTRHDFNEYTTTANTTRVESFRQPTSNGEEPYEAV